MMETQSEQILAYLKTGKPITPIEALKRFRCFRLGARIWELKQAGHEITTRFVGDGRKHWAEYRLIVKGRKAA